MDVVRENDAEVEARNVPMDDQRDFETITVFYNGEKSEFRMDELDIARQEDGRCNPTDAQVKEALLGVLGATDLNGYDVDRYEKVINVRPRATLG